MKCFVLSCNSDFHGHIYEDDDPREKYSVHRFPDDSVRREMWLQAIANAENRVIHTDKINFKTARLCSKHFRKEELFSKNGKQFLLKTSVPTIFGSSQGSKECVIQNLLFYLELISIIHSLLEDSGFNDLQVSATVPLGNTSGNTEETVPPAPKRRR